MPPICRLGHTVTYNLSAPNAATGLTATMVVGTAGTGTFTSSALATAGATTVTITNLSSGTGTPCSSAISANNTAVVTVNAAPTYCTNTNTTNTTYYISSFSTTGGTTNITNNASGFSTNGYGNFTAMTVSAVQGSTINFSIATNNGTYTYGFGIWVDWNQDGDFADSGEQMYMPGTYLSTATGSFTVPVTALTGNTRMRVLCNYTSTSPAACTGGTSTECEDYTFNVVALTPCSGTPTGGTSTATVTSGCSGYTRC